MFQQTIVIGRLGSDPQTRTLDDGTVVTSFSLAVNERWTGQDGEPKERVTWYRVTAWRGLGEVAGSHLKKGRLVFVRGRPGVSAWTDQEGKARATLELTAEEIKFLDTPPTSEE